MIKRILLANLSLQHGQVSPLFDCWDVESDRRSLLLALEGYQTMHTMYAYGTLSRPTKLISLLLLEVGNIGRSSYSCSGTDLDALSRSFTVLRHTCLEVGEVPSMFETYLFETTLAVGDSLQQILALLFTYPAV